MRFRFCSSNALHSVTPISPGNRPSLSNKLAIALVMAAWTGNSAGVL